MTVTSKVIITALAVLVTSGMAYAEEMAKPLTQNASTTKIQERKELKAQVVEQKTAKAKTAADKELDKRIEDLNKLQAKIQQFKNLSQTNRDSITSTLNTLISNLNTLRSQIESATSTKDIKALREQITKDYRVYALVMPRVNVIATAEKIIETANSMSNLGVKLENIASKASTTADVSASVQAKLADFKAKLADAKTQAESAISLVIGLVPDQGDKNVMTANTTALKAGRDKVKLAHASLNEARKNADFITKSVVKKEKRVEKPENRGNATSTNATNNR